METEAQRGVPAPVKLPGPIAKALDHSLGAGARNMNGRFLMRGRTLPFQRMLDQKLEQVLDKPRSRQARGGGVGGAGFRSRKRAGRKLAMRDRQLAALQDATDEDRVVPGDQAALVEWMAHVAEQLQLQLVVPK